MKEKIETLIHSAKVFLFMKGSPQQPQCGFSARVVETLQQLKIPFSSFDVLEDAALREELKVYADWATYPQLWIDGKLAGGCDIVMQLAESGELAKMANAE